MDDAIAPSCAWPRSHVLIENAEGIITTVFSSLAASISDTNGAQPERATLTINGYPPTGVPRVGLAVFVAMRQIARADTVGASAMPRM
jgi:hypothetical protein